MKKKLKIEVNNKTDAEMKTYRTFEPFFGSALFEKIDQMDGTKFANLDFVRTHISGQGLVQAFYFDFNGFLE